MWSRRNPHLFESKRHQVVERGCQRKEPGRSLTVDPGAGRDLLLADDCA